MTVFAARRGYDYSLATIHKYMNTELGLRSIVRPKETGEVYIFAANTKYEIV